MSECIVQAELWTDPADAQLYYRCDLLCYVCRYILSVRGGHVFRLIGDNNAHREPAYSRQCRSSSGHVTHGEYSLEYSEGRRPMNCMKFHCCAILIDNNTINIVIIISHCYVARNGTHAVLSPSCFVFRCLIGSRALA